MTSTADRIVGELGKNKALQAVAMILGAIPDPTLGYLRGSLIERRNIDYALTNDLGERDLNNLVYVGKLGKNDYAISFM